MCGINGFYCKDLSRESQIDYIKKMNLAIKHRGPDGDGFHLEKDFVFGHVRLSILDLSIEGKQPMSTDDGRFKIVFNGEIYNFKEIKRDLELSGESFNSGTDTEVLLKAIRLWGFENAIQRSIGMFAIALLDTKENLVYFARDRMGEKPLYYCLQDGFFAFSSEIKAFHEHPKFISEIDRDSLGLYFRYSYIPCPRTIFKNVYKLPPGNLMVFNLNQNKITEIRPYWKLRKVQNFHSQIEESKLISEANNRFESIVRRQMISDVPLGAFLSGGIDSSLVVAVMQKISSIPIKTFTIGFEDKDYDESIYAKKVAKYLGTDHTEVIFGSNEILETIPDLSTVYDEPFADSSQIPTLMLSRITRNQVKVSLSGDGGDELFCGYTRYDWTMKLWRLISKFPYPLRVFAGHLIQVFPEKMYNHLYHYFISFFSDPRPFKDFGSKCHRGAYALRSKDFCELYDAILVHWNQPSVVLGANLKRNFLLLENCNTEKLNLYEKMMYTDSATYLPDDLLVKVDRSSMSTSLETRAPFLDEQWVSWVWGLTIEQRKMNSQPKGLLKEMLSTQVPSSLFERPKKGFGVPLGKWLKTDLSDWVVELLNSEKIKTQGILNVDEVIKVRDEHLSGEKNWEYHLWDLLMFQSWFQRWGS
ncbi:MAG: asparagine synthase (glutamine-hydrolyzing) [Bdellovibrionaceae bacterium]|nr:asparagine synthase (glutamine-hydrolyzing) [Pseudobdellovibrionaceae bacterium]|tara:strand:- start:3265 stop:5193 length:1929 start_codon:yes stop_codon:yes gene_type:complete